MATTVRIPLELLTVAVNSANAFWTAKSGASIDQSYIAYVDSGLGTSFWWGYVPSNVSATPAWSLEAYHSTNVGAGGDVVLNVFARVLSNTSTIDIAPTMLVNSAVVAVGATNVISYSALSGGNFDSVVSLSATNYVIVKFNRDGGNTSDTLSDQWNLASVVMKVDIA